MNKRNNKIGIFDSGVGGLTILEAINETLPNENLIYLADQAHVPYGQRSLEEIKKFSKGITEFLISKGAKIIVVACNTASAAALYFLRDEFTEISFVGMEPALKPAAEKTETGVVGVLATSATFEGDLYASVVERFASEVKIMKNPCIGLVEEIEKGNIDGEETKKILDLALAPMIKANIDTVVLGCTHYPFVFPLLREIVGPDVRLINPAPAIARQVKNVLESQHLLNTNNKVGEISYLSTGNLESYKIFLNKYKSGGNIEKVRWGSDLHL